MVKRGVGVDAEQLGGQGVCGQPRRVHRAAPVRAPLCPFCVACDAPRTHNDSHTVAVVAAPSHRLSSKPAWHSLR